MRCYYLEVYNNNTGEVKYQRWFYNYQDVVNEVKSWEEILGPKATILTNFGWLVLEYDLQHANSKESSQANQGRI